jgi:hypothetical protein
MTNRIKLKLSTSWSTQCVKKGQLLVMGDNTHSNGIMVVALHVS